MEAEPKGWRVFIDPPEVAPIDDERPHVFGWGCWCRPFDDDGVIVHNALDEREAYERGERRAC